MKNKKRILPICLCVIFLLSAFPIASKTPKDNQGIKQAAEQLKQIYLSLDKVEEDSYEVYRQSVAAPVFEGEISFPTDYTSIDDIDSEIKNVDVIAPEDAWYTVVFEYVPQGSDLLPTIVSISVDSEFPFKELQAIRVNNIWSFGEFQLDRYGNECVSMPARNNHPATSYIRSSNGLYADPMLLFLTKGAHALSFQCEQGSVAIGTVVLTSLPKTQPQTATQAPGSAIITLEAERITTGNTPNIRTAAEYNSKVTPYATDTRKQNLIADTSYRDGGALVEYALTAPTDGYYNVLFNYRQSEKPDFPVFRRLYIDSVVPSDFYENIRFDSSKSFTKLNTPPIYLAAGEHILGLEVSLDFIRNAVLAIEEVTQEISDLALVINDITGGNTDRFRDFRLSDYGINSEEKLLSWAQTVEDVYTALCQFNPDVSNPGEIAPLAVAIKMLKILAQKPDELPKRLNEFAYGTSSVRQYLVTFVGSVQFSQLGLDQIVLYQDDAVLPKKVSVFKTIFLAIHRFFNSFTQTDYTAQTGGETLQVWVNRPRQYLEIMQAMSDSEFTKQTGIAVNLSIVPDQQKLILSNISGKAPDAAIAINSGSVYDLAVRGVLADMRQFDTFKKTARLFAPGMLIPGVCDNGMYALPETFNFWVLYYRSDILQTLGLSVPDTMDDVRNMLPQLRRRGMNFNSQVSNFVSKPYAAIVPFVYETGGNLFGDTAELSTGFQLPKTIAGLEVLTDNYNVYSMNFDIQNFYQYFRDGRTPVGVSDYGTFNLLTNAAPELAGKWGIAPYPGMIDENGDVNRYTSGAAESCVIFEQSNKQNEAWQFITWWLSTSAQTEFALRLQSTLGNEYMWNPANLEAMASAPWNRKSRDVILEQLNWTYEVPRVPGGYMVERELSNAINDVVLQGRNLRSSLDDASKRVNRELVRKLEEFGYTKDSEYIKPFVLPDIELMKEWVK